MKLDPGTRTRLFADMALDIDPTGSTVEVSVDDAWHAATWQGSPVNTGGKWTQTARTTDYFAGPAHTAPAGATVLAAGRHATRTRVTIGADTLVHTSTPIDVQ